MGITHATVATGTDAGTGEIHKAQWNADHAGDFVSGSAGSGGIIIPGLAGDQAVKPSSPSSYDDEFDTLSGWTTLGSLSTSNVTDWPSHWHVRKATVGLQLHGIYKAAPSVPYAAVIRVSDYTSIKVGNFNGIGLMVGDSTPTAWMSFMFNTFNMAVTRDTWTNSTTRASSATATTNDLLSMPPYLMIAVNSSTSCDCWFSQNGFSWKKSFSAINPGFTPSKIGIGVEANGTDAEMAVDFIRFWAGSAGQAFNPATKIWA